MPALRDDDRALHGLLGAVDRPMSDGAQARVREAARRLFEADGPAEGGALLEPGRVVGTYRVDRVIGAGGQAVVYRAWHTRLPERAVALKVPHGQSARRMLQEARVLASLQHPGICTLLDLDPDADVPYLALEYLSGGSLADRLAAGPLPEAEASRIALALLDALSAAHAKSVVHRDLKPQNILFDEGDRLRISDFGIGKVVSEALSLSLTHGSRTGILGTPLYLAPEQERPGAPVDGRTDLYAFGKLLYHMLTGEAPRTVRPVERARPGLAEGWSEVVFRLTETDPDRRYPTAEACAEAIRALHAPPEAVLPSPDAAPRAASAALRRAPGVPGSLVPDSAPYWVGSWLAQGDRLSYVLAFVGAVVLVGGLQWGTRDAWIGTLVGAVGIGFATLLAFLRHAVPRLRIGDGLRLAVPLFGAMFVVIGAEPHVVLKHAGTVWVGLGLVLGSIAAFDALLTAFPAVRFSSRVPAIARVLLGLGGAVTAPYFTARLPSAFSIVVALWILVELAVVLRLIRPKGRTIVAIALLLTLLFGAAMFLLIGSAPRSSPEMRVPSFPRAVQGGMRRSRRNERPRSRTGGTRPGTPTTPRAQPQPRSPERSSEGGF